MGANVRGRVPQASAPWALGLLFLVVCRLWLDLLCAIVQMGHAISTEAVPLIAKAQEVAGVIQPDSCFLGIVWAHDAAELLDVGTE